ncbi:MAG: hypothetical protein ACLQVG_02975 [Terriglobia bacterium]
MPTTTVKKCPRCALINPPTAQRCDCGYDFKTRKIESPYFRQELPGSIRDFTIFLTIWQVLGALLVLSINWQHAVAVGIWSALVWPTYFQLKKKKSWARLVLAVLTAPIGSFLLLTREVKLYMLQRD